ncbi:DUF882 domain-containing protein [Microvirga aerophila]|uniref:DUF882 domain-containing protein n=1 Tax=Microvirga aerophila TaxID=670291 RepID=UPI0035A21C56
MESASIDRRRSAGERLFRFVSCSSVAGAALLAATAGTQDAAANGDRSLTIFHTHTRESATITFRRNGQYDERGLEQLNWILRDWRVEKSTKMDPRLFDILWEVQREAGSTGPIHIVSAYRSPETNGALRRRSSGVSEHSQHMLGKAMDVRLPDVDTARLRAVAMKMQYGGVGYYSSSQFVHIDTGSVRAWPRMSEDQLVRLFPDGKTLHLPPSGKPLPGYEVAKAEILSRNANLATYASAGGGSVGNILTALFGRRDPTPPAQAERPAEAAPIQVASASPDAMEAAIASAPLPPRRPRDAAAPEAPAMAVVASLPTTTAPVVSTPAPEPVLGHDVKGAVRALFDPRIVVADIGFSSQFKQELSVAHFSGPAVKPLPIPQLPPVQEAKIDPLQKARDPAVRTSVSAAW